MASGVSVAHLQWKQLRHKRGASFLAFCNVVIPLVICSPPIAYGLLYAANIGDFNPWAGARAFLLSVLPALIVLFIRSHVPESPAFAETKGTPKPKLMETLRSNWGVAIYAVVLMMCFNLFSHGTQDLYPTFLQKQHAFDSATVSWITIVANLGAIVGGLFFGFVSEKIGRVNAITVAALIALPALPLWAYSSTPFVLALGAFVMQISVQGALGRWFRRI